MKALDLSFVPRFQLIGMLSAVTGNLGKVAPLQQIWALIRFTDDEASQIKRIDNGNGTTTFEAPQNAAGFGALSVQLEDSQAKALLQEIDAYQGFRVGDVDWVAAVKKQLQ